MVANSGGSTGVHVAEHDDCAELQLLPLLPSRRIYGWLTARFALRPATSMATAEPDAVVAQFRKQLCFASVEFDDSRQLVSWPHSGPNGPSRQVHSRYAVAVGDLNGDGRADFGRRQCQRRQVCRRMLHRRRSFGVQ